VEEAGRRVGSKFRLNVQLSNPMTSAVETACEAATGGLLSVVAACKEEVAACKEASAVAQAEVAAVQETYAAAAKADIKRLAEMAQRLAASEADRLAQQRRADDAIWGLQARLTAAEAEVVVEKARSSKAFKCGQEAIQAMDKTAMQLMRDKTVFGQQAEKHRDAQIKAETKLRFAEGKLASTEGKLASAKNHISALEAKLSAMEFELAASEASGKEAALLKEAVMKLSTDNGRLHRFVGPILSMMPYIMQLSEAARTDPNWVQRFAGLFAHMMPHVHQMADVARSER